METFIALLAGESPTQKPVARRFDVFFDQRLNKRLSKQWWSGEFPAQMASNAENVSISWRHHVASSRATLRSSARHTCYYCISSKGGSTYLLLKYLTLPYSLIEGFLLEIALCRTAPKCITNSSKRLFHWIIPVSNSMCYCFSPDSLK